MCVCVCHHHGCSVEYRWSSVSTLLFSIDWPRRGRCGLCALSSTHFWHALFFHFFIFVCFTVRYILLFFSVTSEKKYFVSVINIFANTFGYLIIKQLIRSNPDENPAEMCCSFYYYYAVTFNNNRNIALCASENSSSLININYEITENINYVEKINPFDINIFYQ